MKKFRIVTILLALCLITSSFVGNTFAKYTSSASGSDVAVVAKWSIDYNNGEISTTDGTSKSINFNLFNTIMGYGTNAVTEENTDNDNDVRDTTEDGKTIIAPGTQGAFTFTITNNSDVTVAYAIDFKEEQTGTTDSYTIPIEYSLGGTTWVTNINDLDVALGARLAYEDDDDDANGKETEVTYTIYWRWSFSDGTTSADIKDTNLGMLAATGSDRPTVTVSIEITAEQVN